MSPGFSLWRNSVAARVVDDAADGRAALERADLAGDLLDGFRAQRLGRAVRRDRDARRTPERMVVRQRFVLEHVERGRGDLAARERVEQVGFDEMRAARDVDDVRAGRESRECARRQDAVGVARARQQVDEHLRAVDARVERAVAGEGRDAVELLRAAAVAAHRHAEGGERAGDLGAEHAEPEDRDGEVRARMRLERLPAALALLQVVFVETAQVAQHRVRHVFDHLLRHARILEPHQRHVRGQRARMRAVEREQRIDTRAEVEDRAQAVARREQLARRAPHERVVGGSRIARLPRAQFGFRQRTRDLVAPCAGFLMRRVEQDLHCVRARAPARRAAGTASEAGCSAPADVADIGRLLTSGPARRRGDRFRVKLTGSPHSTVSRHIAPSCGTARPVRAAVTRPPAATAPPVVQKQSTKYWFGRRVPGATIEPRLQASEGNHARMQQIGVAAAARHRSGPARQRRRPLADLARAAVPALVARRAARLGCARSRGLGAIGARAARSRARPVRARRAQLRLPRGRACARAVAARGRCCGRAVRRAGQPEEIHVCRAVRRAPARGAVDRDRQRDRSVDAARRCAHARAAPGQRVREPRRRRAHQHRSRLRAVAAREILHRHAGALRGAAALSRRGRRLRGRARRSRARARGLTGRLRGGCRGMRHRRAHDAPA
ncbi:Uncharacterised protein [Clostridium sporogenes]|nr:Uncharacterised protein [Clostridium sporogenes]